MHLNILSGIRSLLLLVVLTLVGGKSEAQVIVQPIEAKPPAASTKHSISILAWNVESGGSDPKVIAEQLAMLSGYDVFALCEVDPDDFDTYLKACGPSYKSVHSVTGYDDRLQIIYNHERFELVRQQELDHFRDYPLNNGKHRSPLMVHLRDRKDGTEFQLVENHLARGQEDMRNKQAIGLREWAREQTLPSITVGDFNMDYDFHTERGNQAFVEIRKDNVWTWVKPAKMIDTNWADPDHDGKDNYPDSMLDFAFVAGPAKEWRSSCKVIVRDSDFPDDKKTSDHRPIEMVLGP